MLKKTITYTDYDGMERTEDFWFNLSKTELTKLDAELPGGVLGVLRKIIDKKDRKALVDFIETLILRSYGEKTLDGKRFVKTPDMAEEFMQTPAYDELFCTPAYIHHDYGNVLRRALSEPYHHLAIYIGHSYGSAHEPTIQQVARQRRGHSLRHGTAPLSHAHCQGYRTPHMGEGQAISA